jgi:hypothetical protein
VYYSHEVNCIFGLLNQYSFIVVSWFNVLIYRVNRDLVSGLGNTVCSPQVPPLAVIISTSELYFVVVLALLYSLAPIRTYIVNNR